MKKFEILNFGKTGQRNWAIEKRDKHKQVKEG